MNSTVYFDSHYQIFLRFILRPDLVGSGVLAAVVRMVGTRLAADGSLTRRETQSQHHSLNTDNKAWRWLITLLSFIQKLSSYS